MTPEQITAARCKRCNGAGTVRVQRFTIFETDSAAESEFAFRSEVFPECSARGNKAELDIAAARERCEKAQHLSLRTTQCCDVSIDGAIGAALEFIAHARADLSMALDTLAAKDAEIAESLQVQEVLRKEITFVRDRMRANGSRITELVGWMKAANKFAWAHERTCPRHDADEPCNCGLDAFLCRPRPVIESFHARIAELEQKNAKLNMAWRFEHGASEALVRKCNRLSAALKVAREAIERAPHYSACGWMGNAKAPHAGVWVSNLDPVDSDCNCWKREALAAIDAATTGLPLPLAAPPQPT